MEDGMTAGAPVPATGKLRPADGGEICDGHKPDRSAKADQQPKLDVSWMTGLDTAADILGTRVRLAGVLGIDPRSLRNKLDAGRGISRGDLSLAAAALERLSIRASEHARKLRTAIGTPALDAGAQA